MTRILRMRNDSNDTFRPIENAYLRIAKEKLEECVMWAVKGVCNND